jgi:hypothetical protein
MEKKITKTELRKILKELGTGYNAKIHGIGIHKFYNLRHHPHSFGLRSTEDYKTIHEFFDGLETCSFDECVEYLYNKINEEE